MESEEEMQYLVVTHTLSPKTFYEVRVSRSRSLTDTSGVYQATSANNRGDANWFNTGRVAARWKVGDRNRLGIKVDLTSQVTKGHLLKGGIELMRRDIRDDHHRQFQSCGSTPDVCSR